MAAMIKFGTDGWRGVVADDFTYANLRFASQGVADYLTSKGGQAHAIIGYDCRFASENFADEVARVLAANGVHCVLFDRPSPTQVASWEVIARRASGGVVITASHNPWIFNGLKYKPETGSSAPPEVIAELEDRIHSVVANGADSVKRMDIEDAQRAGLLERVDPRPSYYQQVGRLLDLEAIRTAGLRVVHDCMYGSGYGYIKELLAGGSTQVTELRWERNPYFGGVNPEPIPPNLGQTLALMKQGGNDLCIVTDGDADRVGIIDETGRFVTQLEVYALLMLYLFEVRGWRGPVVKTINMTSMADALAREFGVEVHELPVGFKNVAPKMIETGAVLGGEESGGFGFRGHIPERDGILAGLFFADMIVRAKKPLSRILAELHARVGPHAYARHDIHLPRESYDSDRQRILNTLHERAPRVVAGQEVERVRDDDGVKFYLKDGSWVLLRMSGTEPLIRIYAEAQDARAVEDRLTALEELVGVGGQGGG